ncbi:MAG TPA: hypothetical protein VFC41_08345 [Anaerovoracaceae bacterium]|nr:hypothetical protein [Anaerovoracaceae bacterium]
MNQLIRISLLSAVILLLVFGCSKQEKISIIRNGKTAYSIYTDPKAPESVKTAARALTEKDPEGNISYIPLVLKFYNDVARIVGKEFPDHKPGGYIYG